MNTLGRKQEDFSICLANLVIWIYSQGWQVRWGEVYRPPATAKHYASIGKGIKNSVHTKKLAADLFLVKEGKVTWKQEDYEPLGKKWKSLHPYARWGGDFRNRDAVHFSFIHQGVQ